MILRLHPSESICLSDLPDLLKETDAFQFQQSWLNALEPDFMPGEVRLGWTPEFFCGTAVLKDRLIGNSARKKGDRPWEKGDVFEIFVKRQEANDYWEMHITPENFQMVLHLPPHSEQKGMPLDEMLFKFGKEIPEFKSQVWVEEGEWKLAWRIPWSVFGVTDPREQSWKMAFCRYDYGEKGVRPILSSTAPLKERRFHRIEDWHEIQIRD